MNEQARLRDQERELLFDELHQRYGSNRSMLQRVYYLRKKYAWIAVVRGTRGLKRAVDVIMSLVLLAAFSPIMLVVAALIKATDGGPIFFVDTRIGKWGEPFRFPKFRSMVPNAQKLKEDLTEQNEHQTGVTFKMKRDPRVTRIGSFIRKASIDELPQLWCVIKGEMSLVGPRPPLPIEVAEYSIEERRRLDIRPGITCFWQVRGRSDIPFDQQVQLDLEYIESHSLATDCQILLKTIPAVLLGKGAY